jgi:putative flippase GtrA
MSDQSSIGVPTKMHHLRTFLKFAFLSGLGWVCDFITFTLLLTLFDVPAFIANFVSSYVGVTFVYFTSLQFVFSKRDTRRGRFMLLYWSFQFVSILAYSAVLHRLAAMLVTGELAILVGAHGGVWAKIIVTPVNLLTNFLFMKFLAGFMQDEKKIHV